MDLTISVDSRTFEKARIAAASMGLSMEDLVRGYLEDLAGKAGSGDTSRESKAPATSRGGHSSGRNWNREDLHRR